MKRSWLLQGGRSWLKELREGKSTSKVKQQKVSLNSGFALLVSALPEKCYAPQLTTGRNLGRNRCPQSGISVWTETWLAVPQEMQIALACHTHFSTLNVKRSGFVSLEFTRLFNANKSGTFRISQAADKRYLRQEPTCIDWAVSSSNFLISSLTRIICSFRNVASCFKTSTSRRTLGMFWRAWWLVSTETPSSTARRGPRTLAGKGELFNNLI